MFTVIFGKEGHPVSDFEVFDWVDFNLETYLNGYVTRRDNIIRGDKVVKTCNETVLLAFNQRVLEGIIDLSDIEFYFEDERLDFDPILGLQNPKGKEMGIYQGMMDKCLKLSYDKMKQAKTFTVEK